MLRRTHLKGALSTALAFVFAGTLTVGAQEAKQGAKPAAAAPRPKAAPRGEAKLELGGKKITITYGRPSTAGPGYKSMQTQMKDGFIWRMGSNQATKIVSETDLKFGDVTVKAGSYSLWAKRVGNGWHLLFHPKADVWGMPAQKDGFVAEVPMQSAKAAKDAELVTIELAKDGDGGVLKLLWGSDEGTVKFTAAK